MTTKPLLMKGDIMHCRLFPKQNTFHYQSTYISFPISKINSLKTALFSLEKFNLFGLSTSQYGDKEKDLSQWIGKILEENAIENIKDIILVTHPKVLGYVFNPVSFWMCVDENNQLKAVLSEVNNTCGQKHRYLCYKSNAQPIQASDWIEANKEFYVSPFMDIKGTYRFRFDYGEEKMHFFINYVVDGKLKLSTSLKCEFQEFNTKNLLIRFLKMPFFTFKTVILIHYQALKLYLKSIKYHKCPKGLKKNLTIGKL